MADSKIEFSYDNLHFACEGEKEWVEKQLNQVLNRITGLNNPSRTVKTENTKRVQAEESPKTSALKPVKGKRGRKPKVEVETNLQKHADEPLYEFLRDKRADKNQVRKFLATAVYLHSQGEEKFSSPLISNTLKNAGIGKLINASDCLNKNEKKGYCIKDKKEFILTELGIQSILGTQE